MSLIKGNAESIIDFQETLIFVTWLKSILSNTYKLYANLPDCNCFSLNDLFQNYRPDIAMIMNNVIIILELTVCHKINLTKAKQYKAAKYSNISSNLTATVSNYGVKVFTYEVSTLGFISDISDFWKVCLLKKTTNK